jgi:hypothetical protein
VNEALDAYLSGLGWRVREDGWVQDGADRPVFELRAPDAHQRAASHLLMSEDELRTLIARRALKRAAALVRQALCEDDAVDRAIVFAELDGLLAPTTEPR